MMDASHGLNSALDRAAQLAEQQRQALGKLQGEISELGQLLKSNAPNLAEEDAPELDIPLPHSFWKSGWAVPAAIAALVPAALLGAWCLADKKPVPGPASPAGNPQWSRKSSAKTDVLSKLLVISDEAGRSALGLVYAHKLPGRRDTILDLLGERSASFLDSSSWKVERLIRDAYLVTGSAGSNKAEEPFEFEADLASGVVLPSPKTEERLLAASSVDASPRGR